MEKIKVASTFLVRSTHNNAFGTAFCVAKDELGSFLVTCTHVVEACGKEQLEVIGKSAKLLHLGSSDDIDLAVIYIEGLMDAEILTLSTEKREIETTFILDGFKPHKSGNYLQRPLQGSIANISQIHSPKRTIRTYELMIEKSYSIEKGYSGSAIVSNDQVIGVATDRNSSGKQAYAIPIGYLKEIWEDMPPELFAQEEEPNKSDFISEVFASLDRNPMLLYSTDKYNHIDYIEHIRTEAKNIFEKSYVIDINCGRFRGLRDRGKFFNRLGKKIGFKEPVEDAFDFMEAFESYLEASSPYKTFILITHFEKLADEVRNTFAETLRDLYQDYRSSLNLVIFGGEKLVKLKHSTGEHSYFNFFSQKMIPTPSFEQWKKRFDYLDQKSYRAIMEVTGGYQKLAQYCFEKGAKSSQEAKKLIYESYFKSELFLAYKEDDLCMLLSREQLGDFHPYSDNELLYRLYWDNLIVEDRGQFVWRSGFIVELGQELLGCK